MYEDYKIEYPLPYINGKKQLDLYRTFHKSMREGLIASSHDVSDGGVLISLAEKMMGTPYGMQIELSGMKKHELTGFFFNEGAGRFVVTVNPKDAREFEDNLTGHFFTRLGKTTNDEMLAVALDGVSVLAVSGSECMDHYKIQTRELV